MFREFGKGLDLPGTTLPVTPITPSNAAIQRPYTPRHPRPKYTREAATCRVSSKRPGKGPPESTLCFVLFLKVNSPRVEDSSAWHPGRGPHGVGPRVLLQPGLNGGRRQEGPGPSARTRGVPGGAAEGQGRPAGTRRAGARVGVGRVGELTAACPWDAAASAWPARSRRGSRSPQFSGSHCPRGCPS